MIPTVVVDNLLAWSAQVSVLVAIGALAALTLSTPRARLIFWQGILAIALLLPAIEPWHQPPAENAGTVVSATNSAPVVIVHSYKSRFAWKRKYLLLVIAAGAALRFLWIGAGLLRLRRHRLDARMLTIPPVPFSNPLVRWYVSSTVGGPVTFGFLNPSILLPTRVVELPGDLREAIAYHELAHVRRRDWLFVLFEESIRSALWFHPAIWFVLSRIQLAREQVVDAEVVGLTCDRERYLDALIAVAAQRLLPDVAPAPLFLKKRQLAVRVAAVLKETRMSRSRTLFSFTTVCSAAFVAVRLAVWMFPMQATAQTPQGVSVRASMVHDGPGVVVEPGAKILHRSPVFFPAGVTTLGSVTVETTVNSKGEVTDAHVISGPDEFRSVVLGSVLNWHFSTDGGLPAAVQSTVRFVTAPHSVATPAPSSARTPTSHLRSINMMGISDELADKVLAALPVHVGDPFGSDELARVRETVKEVDQHLMAGISMSNGDTTLMIILRPSPPAGGMAGILSGETGLASAASAAAANFPPAASGVMRIRVGGNVQAVNLIKKVTPAYPPLAKQARIQGQVRFTALIDREGNIATLQLVSGHPLLVQSAQDAVKQWQYKPTLLDGNPVEVMTQIDVNYTLSQ